MNTARSAPRESASIPSAPLPANKSIHVLALILSCNQLNNVSRTLSDVGFSPSVSGKVIFLLRKEPPIIRREFCLPVFSLFIILQLLLPAICKPSKAWQKIQLIASSRIYVTTAYVVVA